MVGVFSRFSFRTLFAAVTAEDVFVVFEIVTFVFIEMIFRHLVHCFVKLTAAAI